MVFVYLCGNDEKGKSALCEQFKKTTKKKPKYWSTIEAQYGRDPISKRQWNKLQFWEKVIGDHYSQVWTRKYIF